MFPATFTRRLWPQDTSGQHLAYGPAAQTMRAKRRSEQGPGMTGTRAGELRPIHPLRRTGPPTSLPCSFPPRPSHHSVLQGAIFSTDWGRGSQHRNQNPGVWEAHHHPCLLVGLFFFFGCAEWHMGSWFLDQGLSPRSLQWKCRVLTTGLSGKSLPLVFKCSPRKHKSHWRQDLSHCLPTAPRTPGIP